MQTHKMLSRKDLAARWNVGLSTVHYWIAQKKIKPNRVTNMFPEDYIEAIEREGIDVDTVTPFALRARDRRIEQLENENAMLKSTLFQISSMASEATSKVIREKFL